MTATATWRYRQGQHWAVVGPTAAALLVGEAALPLAERIWPLLAGADADVDRVLDELGREGLAGLPSFVLVEAAADVVRVLVRGTALALLRPSDGPGERTLDGVGFRSWREDVVRDIGAAVLSVSGEQVTGPELPVHGGIIRVASLAGLLGGASAAPVVTAARAGATPRPEPHVEPRPEPHVEPRPRPHVGPAPEPGPEPRPGAGESVAERWGISLPAPPPAAPVEPAEPAAATAEAGAGAGPAVRQHDPAVTLDHAIWAAAAEHADGRDSAPAAAEADPAAPVPSTPAPPGPARGAAAPGPAANPYLDLIAGMTVVGSVENAAVRPVEAEPAPGGGLVHGWGPPVGPPLDSTPPPAVAEALPPVPASPAPAIPPAAVPPPASRPGETTPPAPPSGLISAIPFLGGAPRPAAPPTNPVPGPADADAHADAHAYAHADAHADPDADADLTVGRVAGGAAQPAPASRAGWLPAVVCSEGHASPPEADRCRVCGADVAAAPQQWVERPVIGRLRFDGPPGIVPVTGPLVIGRAPRADRVSGDAVPTMVTVPSAEGDVSRSHLRVAVEGWHLLVVDLGATNGTVVTDPNGESRRLRPDEEKLVLPGSRVVLADTVGFVFEAQP